jgi:hypothetical protein
LNSSRTVSDIVNADIKSDAAIAGTKIAPNFGTQALTAGAGSVITGNTSTDALRITQEGAGNALVVEDSANPDSTPLVVNNVGQIISGATSAVDANSGLQLVSSSTSAPNGSVTLSFYDGSGFGNNATYRSRRARGSSTAPEVVQAGDLLGSVAFHGHDGSTFIPAANIVSLVDGTPGTNDMPGALAFRTTSDGAATVTERMRITSAGNVGINTTTPTERLDVNGTVKATAFSGPLTGNVTGTASAIADSTVTDAKVAAGAAIADTKLATISTAGKVSNSATTATNANTASAIVARDASGNFSAGTITASISGNVTGNLTGTASAIADGSVSAAKIVDANVTNAKLASDIDASKLTTGTLPIARIADAAVTPAKLSQPLTLATAQNTTSGTSIDFTGIPSWVKRITVMLNGVSTNSTSVPIIQLGTSGGLQNSGYTASAGFVQGANSSTALFSTGFGLNQAHVAASVYSGHVAITNITGNSWVASLVGAYTNVSGLLLGSGSVSLSGALDRIRLTTVNGTDTFDAGSVNIMYEG